MNDTTRRRTPGCLPLLGGPLLAFGIWMIAQALLLPHEAETVRLSVITGAFAAGLGGWLLAARMRRVFHRAPPAESAPPPGPADAGAGGADASILENLGPGIGCLAVCLGFLLVGPVFLYFYFSGAPTRRGNPVMGLIAGTVFTLLGLLGVYVLISGRRQERRTRRNNDPRRLP